jgi:hypothetical protein
LWDGGALDYDLAKLDTSTGSTVIEDSEDINPRPDGYWFHPTDSGYVKVIRPGNPIAAIKATLFETSDDFATSPTETQLPYSNLAGLVPNVSSKADYVIYAAVECQLSTSNLTNHAILVADDSVDSTSVYGKAGQYPDSSPYTGSIPETAQGCCFNAIHVAE